MDASGEAVELGDDKRVCFAPLDLSDGLGEGGPTIQRLAGVVLSSVHDLPAASLAVVLNRRPLRVQAGTRLCLV